MNENMNIENDEIEELDEDLDDNCTNDDVDCDDGAETDPVKRKGRQLGEKRIQRLATIMLNDTMRIYILESERSMHFERKSKNEDSDKWMNDGYFSNMDSLLSHVIRVCIKEKIYTKQIKEYRELKDMIKEIKLDMKTFAQIINESIRNNDYLKELREM